MKKFIAVILAMALVMSLVACGGEKGGHTPQYGEKLVLAEKLNFKSEYKDAVSPRTRELISAYLERMVAAYNIVDLSVEQNAYFGFSAYYYTNDFLNSISEGMSGVYTKDALGEELNEREQLFKDMIDLIYELPTKFSDIEAAVFYPEEDTDGEENTDPGDETEDEAQTPEDEETDEPAQEEEDDESDYTGITEAYIPRELWQELFDKYVEVFTTIYEAPFVRPPRADAE